VNTFAHNSTYRAGMARLRKNFVHPECGLVYALLDPLSHEVRYVGKTTKGVSERVFAHFHFHTACREWMVGLLSENLFPQVHILELVPLEPDGGHNVLRSREIAWINALYSAGSPLLNRQSFKLRDAISEMPVGDLLSVADAGRLLGLSRYGAWYLVKQGDLVPCLKVSGGKQDRGFFDRKDVEELAIRRASGMNGNGRKRGRKPKVSSTLKESK
jgi:hypothetical protein